MERPDQIARRLATFRVPSAPASRPFVGGPLRAVPQLVLLLDQHGVIARVAGRGAGPRLGQIDCRPGRTVHAALHPGCDGHCTLSADWDRAWQVHRDNLGIEWEVEPRVGQVGLKLRLEPMRFSLGELFGSAVRGAGTCSVLFVQNLTEARQGDGALLLSEPTLHGRLEPLELNAPPGAAAVASADTAREATPAGEDTIRLPDLRQAERQRIATELHDSLGQTLGQLRFEIESAMARARVDGESTHDDELQRIHGHAQRSLQELRELTRSLRSATLETMGLRGSLEALVAQFRLSNPGVNVRAELDAEPERVPRELAFAVHRIAQEALNNVARHAGATTVTVVFANQHTGLELVVRDNGRGLPLAGVGRRGLGIGTMRERVKSLGGRFELISRPGKGCLVRASWDARAVRLLRK